MKKKHTGSYGLQLNIDVLFINTISSFRFFRFRFHFSFSFLFKLIKINVTTITKSEIIWFVYNSGNNDNENNNNDDGQYDTCVLMREFNLFLLCNYETRL